MLSPRVSGTSGPPRVNSSPALVIATFAIATAAIFGGAGWTAGCMLALDNHVLTRNH